MWRGTWEGRRKKGRKEKRNRERKEEWTVWKAKGQKEVIKKKRRKYGRGKRRIKGGKWRSGKEEEKKGGREED